eukprot:317835_1
MICYQTSDIGYLISDTEYVSITSNVILHVISICFTLIDSQSYVLSIAHITILSNLIIFPYVSNVSMDLSHGRGWPRLLFCKPYRYQWYQDVQRVTEMGTNGSNNTKNVK